MPIYEYECKNCGRRFEKMQSISADPLQECVYCGKGPITRVFHPVGVIFKGSGWYITDSRKSTTPTASTDTKDKSEKPAADSAPAKESPADSSPTE
jgi:putative FmdB family regulatory protein